MANPLLTLTEAKNHLKIPLTTTSEDEDLTLKIAEASDIIVDYLKEAWADPEWTEDTVPRPVKAAVQLQLAHLTEHRGDDPDADEKHWQAIERLLLRFRDPALA